MIKHYFKIATRILKRHAGYTIINVGGLGIGLAACLMIALYVQSEFNVDRHHVNRDRIFRLVLDAHTPEGLQRAAVSALPFGLAMKEEFPEVEEVVRLRPGQALFSRDAQQYQEDRLLFVDETYLSVFTAPLLYGDPTTALDGPYEAVLTQQAALKYFGRTDVVGEILTMDHARDVIVQGVLADGFNSHLQSDVFISFATWEVLNPDVLNNWTWYNFYTYLLLRDSDQARAVESRIPELVERRTAGLPVDENIEYDFLLQPLNEIYLYSDRFAEVGVTGNREALLLFGVIALLILIVAGINFSNLSTARSVQRAREVGVRKVLGAGRRQLVGQLLGEALLLSLLAGGFALLLCSSLVPIYNSWLGKSLSLATFLVGANGIFTFLAVLAIGLLAGLYPAVVLSQFMPKRALAGRPAYVKGGFSIKQALVVFQFAVSALLIISTTIIYRQLGFLQSQHLGFDSEQVLSINFRNDSTVVRQYEALKSVLSDHPSVVSVSTSDFVPGIPTGSTTAHIFPGNGEIVHSIYAYGLVDYDFFSTYSVEFAAGRDFSRSFGTDATEAFIVNEATVKSMGLSRPEEALGRRIEQWGRDGTIVGVVNDFNYQSLRHAIEPIIFHIRPDWFRYFSVRLRTGDTQQTLADLSRTWQSMLPNRPFEYAFVEDQFNRQYLSDERFGQLIIVFAGLAIFIACIGLFGLAAFSMERRVKEVGVRKVLGASAWSIVLLFSREYARLVGIALAVAAPLAYFAMRLWLAGFAYRVTVHPFIFIVSGIVVLGIACGAVCFHAVRAALSNPVDTLRWE